MEIIAEWGYMFIILAVIFGIYMTWGIGANDVANAMGTSVGAKAITVKQAIIIAAIFEFAGAFIAGGSVTKTIRKGIIDASSLADKPEILVYGMLAALLAAGVWLMIASYKGWPVSTTHSIVGAIIGFAIVGIDADAVNWGEVSKIVMSWVVSPLLGGTLSYLIMMSIYKFILNAENPLQKAKTWGPVYIFFVGWIVSLVTLFKGLKHLSVDLSVGGSLLVATGFGLVVAFLGKQIINRVKVEKGAERKQQYHSVERVFAPMMIFTACAMAFAHGSNDVANGIGPLASVVSIVNSGGEVMQSSALPLWILVLGGAGIVVGLATMGYRVMQTIGSKITALTPTRGFSAELAAATTVVLATKLGLPVSTTHIAVGAVMGVGLARGVGALDLRIIGKIIITWVVTLPVGAFLAAMFFFLFRGMFS